MPLLQWLLPLLVPAGAAGAGGATGAAGAAGAAGAGGATGAAGNSGFPHESEACNLSSASISMSIV